MWKFKPNIRIALLFVVLNLVVVACVSNKPSDRGRSGATFDVQEVELLRAFDSEFDESGLAAQRRFSLRACVRDVLRLDVLPDQAFRIEGGLQVHSLRTHADGCLRWTETLSYTDGLEPKWVTIKRTVIGEGSYKGTQDIELLINPWIDGSSGYPQLVDLRFHKNLVPLDKIIPLGDESLALKGLNLPIERWRSQLFLSQVRITFEEHEYFAPELVQDENGEVVHGVERTFLDEENTEGGVDPEHRLQAGAVYKVNIEAIPNLRTINERGELVDRPLTRGRIHLKPYMIQNLPGRHGGNLQINEDVRPETSDFSDGVLSASFLVPIPVASSLGQVEFGLRAVSEDSRLLPFEGVYILGKLSTALSPGRRMVDLKPEVREVYNDHQAYAKWYQEREAIMKENPGLVEEALPDWPGVLSQYIDRSSVRSLLGHADGLQLMSYRLSRPRINFSAISKEECESALEREVQYQVLSCVYNPVDLRGAPATKFDVYQVKPNGEKEFITTQPTAWDGCFIWENTQSHNYYNRERYYVNDFVVENSDLGIRESMKIAINPWDYGFTFGRDAAQLQTLVTESSFVEWEQWQDAEIQGNTLIKGSRFPEIVLLPYASNFMENNYLIDDQLFLTVQRTYRYMIPAQVARHDSLTAGVNKDEKLRAGVYMVRVVLVRNWQESQGGSGQMVSHESDYIDMIQDPVRNAHGPRPRPDRLPEYITHFDRVVEVRDGRIQMDIDFSFRDLYLIGSRNTLLVEVYPVDPKYLVYQERSACIVDYARSQFKIYRDSELKSNTYSAPQILLSERDGAPFMREAFTIDEVLAENEHRKSREREFFEEIEETPQWRSQVNLNAFANREGLEIVDLGESRVLQDLTERLNAEKEMIRYFQNHELLSHPHGATPDQEQEWHQQRMSQQSPENEKQAEHESYQRQQRSYDQRGVRSKLQAKYFDAVRPDDILRLVHSGIQIDYMSIPFVNNWVHLMCGFWFGHFYDEYMTQKHIDGMAKWVDVHENFETYDDWLRNLDETMYSQPLRPEYPFREIYQPRRLPVFEDKPHASALEALFYDNIGGNPADAHPYLRCLDNPWEFFVFEKKVAIDQVARDHDDTVVYSGGVSYNYSLTENIRVDQSYGWQTSMGYNFSIGGTLNFFDQLFKGGPGIGRSMPPSLARNMLTPVATDLVAGPGRMMSFAGFRMAGDYSTSRRIDESLYRGQSLGYSNNIQLIASRSDFTIELNRYRHCLVVRPRLAAFNGYESLWKDHLQDRVTDQIPYRRSGLLFCTPEMSREPNGQRMAILESYYYVYQHFAPGGYLQDPRQIQNRPFLIMVRGPQEFEKFLRGIQAHSEPEFKDRRTRPAPLDRFWLDLVGNSIKAFENTEVYDMTGFYPGVYSVTRGQGLPPERERDSDPSVFKDLLGWVSERNPLDFIPW